MPKNDSVNMTANAIQYTVGVYAISTNGTVKYEDMNVTGMNKMETLARRMVMRVRRSMYEDSLMVMRLKFCSCSQPQLV